jgi:hypothetical protein
MLVTCNACWNGEALDSQHPEYDGEIDKLFDKHPSSERAFSEVKRRFPDAVITCPKCEGTGKITIDNK